MVHRFLMSAAITAGVLAVSGCQSPQFDGGCRTGCRPTLRERLAAPLPVPAALAADDGPHAIQPPYPRFHPVPTHPVFAAPVQYLSEAPGGQRAPEPIGPGKLLRPPPGAGEPPPVSLPRPEPGELESPEIVPPLPKQSGSSGVTRQGPRLKTPTTRMSRSDLEGNWRAGRTRR